MKKITLEILALLAFTAVIFMVLENRYKNYRSPIDAVMADFTNTKDRSKVLLVGNSHSLPLNRSLQLSGKSSTACLTFGAVDLFYMQAFIKKYLPDLPAIKYILLVCDDELIGYNQPSNGFTFMDRMLYPYTDTVYGNRTLDKLLSKSAFFRSNRNLNYMLNTADVASFGNTNLGIASSLFTDEECRVRAIEISTKRFSKKLFAENLGYVETILEFARERAVVPVIIQVPKSECLRSSMDVKNLSVAHALLSETFNRHGVMFMNFTASPHFQRSDFSNPDHLTVEASKRLIEMINDSLRMRLGEGPM